MKIITTREILKSAKAVFELAEREQVAVKRGNKYVNLLVSKEPNEKFLKKQWFLEFLAIPEEYRVNPFEYSESGDLFFADKRNIEHIKAALAEIENGQGRLISKEEQEKIFNM